MCIKGRNCKCKDLLQARVSRLWRFDLLWEVWITVLTNFLIFLILLDIKQIYIFNYKYFISFFVTTLYVCFFYNSINAHLTRTHNSMRFSYTCLYLSTCWSFSLCQFLIRSLPIPLSLSTNSSFALYRSLSILLFGAGMLRIAMLRISYVLCT